MDGSRIRQLRNCPWHVPMRIHSACLGERECLVQWHRSPKTTRRAPSRWLCQATDISSPSDQSSKISKLRRWLEREHNIPREKLKLQFSAGLYSSEEDFRAQDDIRAGEVLLELPADLGITATDAHSEIPELTEGRSELVCLALWLLSERAKGSTSPWRVFLDTLPNQTNTPILWSETERQELLRGSPVESEAASRASAIDAEWNSIDGVCSASPDRYPPGVYNQQGFRRAMSVVFAHAAFLDSAQCFALLPVATLLRRTGQENAAQLDFDLTAQTAAVTAGRSYGRDEALAMYDGRPNGELFLATGTVEDSNPADCLTLTGSLVRADRLFSAKKAVLEALGFTELEEFPIFQDRMPLQLLAYLRLSRVQDPAQLAMVSFERDTVISQNNEYEILQLLMGDVRDRLSAYKGSMEESTKKLQRRDLSVRERLATRLLLSEQRVLQGTVDAVRRRLAPIRGIPTKSGGMANPNEDLKDIFNTLESIPQAPARLLGGFMSWARGEQDPDWKKSGKNPRRRQ